VSRAGYSSIQVNARKLAEEDQLGSELANLECHPRRRQKDVGKLGEVLNFYHRTLAFDVAQFLITSHDLDYLRPRRRQIQPRRGLCGSVISYPCHIIIG